MKRIVLPAVALALASTSAMAWTDSRGHWYEPGQVSPFPPRYEDAPAWSPPSPGGPWGPVVVPLPIPPVAVPVPVPVPPGPVAAPPPPQPLGWVFMQYMHCVTPPTCTIVTDAGGLNVRASPGGPPVIALANGTPVAPIQPDNTNHPRWALVQPACNLVPTWLWSWNTGVTLMRCL
jgi:hypothetical protein